MVYCRRCVLPDTRPGLRIEPDGVCNACHQHESKSGIDWVARQNSFRALVNSVKTEGQGYDCVIPVSGGKDSHWQVIKCLEYGLKPLTVSWAPPSRTKIGWANLENLIGLGVDHLDYHISPEVERKFIYRAFKRFGSPAIPMHLAIHAIPATVAVRFGIPLIVWGENSAFEYGSIDEELTGFKLDEAWRRVYGVTNGTVAQDWVADDLSEKELTPYFGPTDQELENAGVVGLFLGYYFKWDPEEVRRLAEDHGFATSKAGPRTGYYDFADIDDDFISVHHYLKWHKFGFTRTFDNLSLEIRNGRLSRTEAIEIIRARGDEAPASDIESLCRFLGIGLDHFHEIAEIFRNHDLWTRGEDGVWMIEDFLVPYWRWQ